MTFSTLTALSGTTLSTKHNNLYIKNKPPIFRWFIFYSSTKAEKASLIFLTGIISNVDFKEFVIDL